MKRKTDENKTLTFGQLKRLVKENTYYDDPRKHYGYWNSYRACAAQIVSDCIRNGLSDGWSGSEEDLEAIEKICERFGVEYVDDFHGTWRPKE